MNAPENGPLGVPQIVPAMREEARLRAGGYLYLIDRMYDPNGEVPSHAIKGAFAASWIDRGMRRVISGQLDQYVFLQLIAKAVLPVLVTPGGS